LSESPEAAAPRSGPAALPATPRLRRRREHHPLRWLRSFWWKAYRDNLTGLSAMVAYNLLLSLFPLALLALFIAGRVLQSTHLEDSVLNDLQRVFPSAAKGTLDRALENVRNSSTGIGIVALVASVWIGSSFWGALDTAFCGIYHVECRSWLRQKRFALLMLFVVLLFMATTVLVPTAQSLLVSGAEDLPFGLSKVQGLIYAITLGGSLALLFGVLCLIYWVVPNRFVPWRAIWPGALVATVAMALIDYAFPAYLTNISSIAQVGTTFLFVLIVLIWFYLLAMIILVGGVVNALRFEYHDTGAFPGPAPPPRCYGTPLEGAGPPDA
jgi:YihY family inner membrane protein